MRQFLTSFAVTLLVLISQLTGCTGPEKPLDSPEAVARKYAGSPNWRARLQHVLYPEMLTPFIEKHNVLDRKVYTLGDEAEWSTEPADWKALRVGQVATVRTSKELRNPSMERGVNEFYMVRTPDGFKVDDHASWGRNAVTYTGNGLGGEGAAYFLRTAAKQFTPDDVSESDLATWLYMDLYFFYSQMRHIRMARRSPQGEHMAKILADGNRHKVVVKLRLVHRGSMVIDLLQEGWYFPDPGGDFLKKVPVKQRRVLRIRDPRVEGALDSKAAWNLAKSMGEEVRACFVGRDDRLPDLLGYITIKIFVVEDGSVGMTSVLESIPEAPKTAECLQAEIKTWKYPPPKDGEIAIVEQPFWLKRP